MEPMANSLRDICPADSGFFSFPGIRISSVYPHFNTKLARVGLFRSRASDERQSAFSWKSFFLYHIVALFGTCPN
jgi:hypothetical protein